MLMVHIYILQDVNTTFDIIQMRLSRTVRPVGSMMGPWVGTMMKFNLQNFLVQMSDNI